MQWVGEGIAVSIGKQLHQSSFRVMDPNVRVQFMESLGFPPDARLSQGSMIRLAQEAGADYAVVGHCESEGNSIRLSVRIFDLHTLKYGGTMSAGGTLSALPQMENELAWLILANTGMRESLSRSQFEARMRKIPNPAFRLYIQSLRSSHKSEIRRLLQSAVEAFEDFPEAHWRLGELYFQEGNCNSAMPHLKAAGKEPYFRSKGAFMMGTCFLRMGDFTEAIQAFAPIKDLQPSIEVFNNLGVAYLRSGEYPLALNAFREASGLVPLHPVVTLNLALTKQLMGDTAGARHTAEEALKSNPDDRMLRFFHGFLLQNNKEGIDASEIWNETQIPPSDIEKLLLEPPQNWSIIFQDWPPSRADMWND
jgi:tetratricopeptide (TPR) repeat protein